MMKNKIKVIFVLAFGLNAFAMAPKNMPVDPEIEAALLRQEVECLKKQKASFLQELGCIKGQSKKGP